MIEKEIKNDPDYLELKRLVEKCANDMINFMKKEMEKKGNND